MVSSRICDQPRLLDDSARSRLIRRMDRFERRFPQVRLQILCRNFPNDHPYPLYLFWIFNLGRICSEVEKGGSNRVILMAVDPNSSRSGIMPGYGLEPFLDKHELDELLTTAEESWSRDAWEDGFQSLIAGLERTLEQSIYQLVEIFGHSPRPKPTQNLGF